MLLVIYISICGLVCSAGVHELVFLSLYAAALYMWYFRYFDIDSQYSSMISMLLTQFL